MSWPALPWLPATTRATMVGVAALLLGACAGREPHPRQTLTAYVAALKRGDADAAYALLATRTRAAIPHDAFLERFAQLAPELAHEGSRLERDGESELTVDAEAIFAGGTQARLVAEDGTWRVDTGIAVGLAGAQPIETLQALALALERRSFFAVMKLLARPSKTAVDAALSERLEQLRAWLAKNKTLEVTGDHAVIRFDRRKIELSREDGRWKVVSFD